MQVATLIGNGHHAETPTRGVPKARCSIDDDFFLRIRESAEQPPFFLTCSESSSAKSHTLIVQGFCTNRLPFVSFVVLSLHFSLRPRLPCRAIRRTGPFGSCQSSLDSYLFNFISVHGNQPSSLTFEVSSAVCHGVSIGSVVVVLPKSLCLKLTLCSPTPRRESCEIFDAL